MKNIKNSVFIMFIAVIVVTMIILIKYTKQKEKNSVSTNKNVNLDVDYSKFETKDIYFAGGCFWGTEEFFKNINGVLYTEVGYANGNIENPTYEQVLTGDTKFVEAVKVSYNDDLVTLPFLIEMYFKTIDPTTINAQGNDVGEQYRTGIYFTSQSDFGVIQIKLDELQKDYQEKIVVENLVLSNFYKAEEYHQNYLEKNPTGYCHIPTSLFVEVEKAVDPNAKFNKKSKEILKQELSKLQFEVTQNAKTEKAFDNEYYDVYKKGIYVDITTGEPLFSSSDKFDSGCGWPSFSKPIESSLIVEIKDDTLGMTRTEVKSALGDSHLGHVFNDGPMDKGGLRFCINSASLKFIPIEDMEKEGYEKYIDLVE